MPAWKLAYCSSARFTPDFFTLYKPINKLTRILRDMCAVFKL